MTSELVVDESDEKEFFYDGAPPPGAPPPRFYYDDVPIPAPAAGDAKEPAVASRG